MKKKSIAVARYVWRRSVVPLLHSMPNKWSSRIKTLAHHTKMTLLHGHVINFQDETAVVQHHRESIPPLPQQRVIQVEESPVAAEEPHNKILPEWTITEFRELARIEPEVAPTEFFKKQFHVYTPPMNLGPARAYAECSALLASHQPDLIILVPYLVRGGADLGTLHHVEAALSNGRKVLVIATLDADSPWKSRLPAGVGFIEYGKLTRDLSDLHRKATLIRLLLDAPARVIHIINSQLGWEVLKRNGKSLTGLGKRVYVSAFSDGRDAHGALWSYPNLYFVDCWRYLSGVICDSTWYPKDLVRQYGVPRDRLHTAYFPLVSDQTPEYRSQSGGRILWASRITLSKRPDLLIEIAKALPEVGFDVFGYTDSSERHYEAELQALPNIALRGKYDSLAEIAGQGSYSAFLYTTAWDGLPNVLLEATAAGLPVVASAICGVPEFINDQTGYPVFDTDNVDAYVAQIKSAIADPTQRQTKWQQACELLNTRHSPEHFLESLRAIPGYLD